ncbi:hypothetical protein BDZ91DRAFT_546564 [Kalaharituber pfeilii]|nr:hypothetical protein BDZ91DRAFT_546564 [Kalaharituber pfeilii]
MNFVPRGGSPVRRPSESLSGFSSGMETPTVTSDTEHRPPLSADTDSSLAGITFETSHGRFACLYWQSTTGMIWQSKFLLIEHPFTWRLYSIVCVASGTVKPHTPLTAVSWANGLKVGNLNYCAFAHEMG